MARNYRYWDSQKDEEATTADLKTAVQETINGGDKSCFLSGINQDELPQHLTVASELGMTPHYHERGGSYQVTYTKKD